MDEEEVVYLTITYVVALMAIVMASAFKAVSIVVIAMAVFTMAMLAMINWSDYVVFPAVTKLLGITFQPAGGYKIISDQSAIVKNAGGIFYATGYVTANIFAFTFKEEFVEENVGDQLVQASERWERAIRAITFPFKFHVVSASRDVQKVREEIEWKRSYQEFQLSRAQQSGGTSESVMIDINRKMRITQAQLDRISQGEKPISTLMYMETTAYGVSEKAAVDMLTTQINQLQIAFTSFDLSLERVQGREIYTLFNFNFLLPVDASDIASLFSQQG